MDELPERESTAAAVRVGTVGFDDPDFEQGMAGLVGLAVQEIGRALDLSALDGITIATNAEYAAAVANVDRGRDGLHRPTPSSDDVVGIAMTVTVERAGAVKSHIVLNAGYMDGFVQGDEAALQLPLHTIAHECAHVEANSHLERCFPGVALGGLGSFTTDIRWQVARSAWGEYTVTKRCARYAEDPTDRYESSFVTALQITQQRAADVVATLQENASPYDVLVGVARVHARLMTLTAYHLGNLDGFERMLEERPRSMAALQGHWFQPFLDRFHAALRALAAEDGQWADDRGFMALADLHEDLMEWSGVTYFELPDLDLIHVNVA